MSPGPVSDPGEGASLQDRMRDWANAHPDHSRAPDIHRLAKELEEQIAAAWEDELDFGADSQTRAARRVVGAWARARRAWCEVSGEPLV